MTDKQLRDAYDMGVIKANMITPILKFLCARCTIRLIDEIAQQEEPTPDLQIQYKRGFLDVYEKIKA